MFRMQQSVRGTMAIGCSGDGDGQVLPARAAGARGGGPRGARAAAPAPHVRGRPARQVPRAPHRLARVHNYASLLTCIF